VFQLLLSLTQGTTTPPTQQGRSSPVVIDPCKTLCALVQGSDCSRVRMSDGSCLNLYTTQEGSVVSSSSMGTGMSPITVESAFFTTSAGGMRCSKACKKTANCPGSFCKPNGHCKGLFWDDLDSTRFCFDTTDRRCSHETPLHCDPLNPKGLRDREIRHAIESSDESDADVRVATTSAGPYFDITTVPPETPTTQVPFRSMTVATTHGAIGGNPMRITTNKPSPSAIETDKSIDGTRDANSGAFTSYLRNFIISVIIICVSFV
jgi:hypothetical protein